jgi:hypothetical protein
VRRRRSFSVVQEGTPDGEPCVFELISADGRVDARVQIDYADRETVLGHSWYLARDGYPYRNLSRRTEGRGHISLHRQLLGLEPGDGKIGDHINRDRLDNRRANLRVLDTEAQSKQNLSPQRRKRSKHRGVHLYTACRLSKPWVARVQVKGIVRQGYFATEEEAASAAARWRRELMPFATD